MQSLSDLNAHAQAILPVVDLRSPKITFTLPLSAIIQTFTPGSKASGIITSASEIANPTAAEVKFSVELVSNPTTPSGAFEVSFGTLPSGVSLTHTGNKYELSGFTTAAQWNEVKGYGFIVPADIATKDTWFVKNTVSYFDAGLGVRRELVFDIFDPQFYPFADLVTVTGLLALCSNVKVLAASITSAFAFNPGLDVVPSFDVSMESVISITEDMTRARSTTSALQVVSAIWAFPSDFEVMRVTASLFAEASRLRSNSATAEVMSAVGIQSSLTSALAAAVSDDFTMAAQGERVFNTVSVPSGPFTYTEDTNKTFATLFDQTAININSWDPDQEYDLVISDLRTSEVINYPTQTLAATTSGLGTEATYTATGWDPFTNRIVVGGSGLTMRYSNDNGATFGTGVVTGGTSSAFVAAFYNAELNHWIAGTSNGQIFISTDGINWNYQTTLANGANTAFAYKPGYGYVASRGASELRYSADGINWSTISGTSGHTVNNVVYAPEIDTWVAAIVDGVLYSTDALTWTKVTIAAGSNHRRVTWTGEYFVAVTDTTAIPRSTDGINWTTAQAPAGTSWLDITHNRAGNILCAVAFTYFTGNRCMYSSDNGLTWTQLGITLAAYAVTETQNGFFISSTTGTQRGFRVEFNVPKITPGYARVSGTAAEIETALAGYTLVPAIDGYGPLVVDLMIRHAVATSKTYLDIDHSVVGQTVTDVAWPAGTTVTNFSGDILQRLSQDGLDITDTRAGNAYYVSITSQGTLSNLPVANLLRNEISVDLSRSWGYAFYDYSTDTLAVGRGSNSTTTAMVSYSQDLGQSWTDATFTVPTTADNSIAAIWKHGSDWVVVTGTRRIYKGTSLTSLAYISTLPYAVQGRPFYASGTVYVCTPIGVAYSSNLTTWFSHETGSSMQQGTDSPYGKLFVGYNTTSGASVIARFDGSTWTNITAGLPLWGKAIGTVGSYVYTFYTSNSSNSSTPSIRRSSNGTTWSSFTVPSGLKTNRSIFSLTVNPESGTAIMNQFWSNVDGDTDTGIAYSIDNGATWTTGVLTVPGNLLTNAADKFIYTGTISPTNPGLIDSVPITNFAVNGQPSYYATGTAAVVNSGATLTFDGTAHKINIEVGSSFSGKVYGQRQFNIYKA